MKKLLFAVVTLSLLVLFTSCNKDVKTPNQVSENKPVTDIDKGDSSNSDMVAEPAKEEIKTLMPAIELCGIGEIPEGTQILNPDMKNAFADCKEGKNDPFRLKLAENYSFDLEISSFTIELGEFNKHEKLEDTIREIQSMAQYDPKDVKVEDAQELSKRHGIDIKKVTYTVGGNEDTTFHEDYYYTSGEHDYRLGTSMHEDQLQELRDRMVQNLVFVK